MIFGDDPVKIGDDVDICNGILIYASKNGCCIGNNSMITAQSYIIDMDHGIKAGTLIFKQANTVLPISIGGGVWIAAGVKVLKGSKIGDGAVVGSGAIVKSDLPSNSISVGMPAKVTKYGG